jgi:predicted PurR-regulated permease PerM
VAVAVMLVIGLFQLAGRLVGVLLAVVAALILALGMEPAVAVLERRQWSRRAAVVVVFGGFSALLVLLLVLALPAFISQVDAFVSRVPELIEDLTLRWPLTASLFDSIDPAQLLEGGAAFSAVSSLTEVMVLLITFAILTPYFAVALPGLRRWILRLSRKEDRPDVLTLVNRASDRIAGYVAGNLVVSAIAGTVSLITFALLGLPFPLALALWVAVTDVVPGVGAVIGAIPVLAIAAVTDTTLLLVTAGFFAVYQMVENYLIVPRVMKRAVQISTPAVIVAILVGGLVAGVAGALLALPLAAVLKTVLFDVVIEERVGRLREGELEVSGRRKRVGRVRPLP